jgi:16S rRNA (guanine1516-N2)-methyltransferase
MMDTLSAIGFEADELYERALAMAEQYNFIIDNKALPRLCVTADKLVLLSENFLPLFVDFNSMSVQKRRDEGKKQGLVRACKPTKGLRIMDVTAGWGRDAAVLASFGADVLMLERQPIMAALLADGLSRLPSETALKLALLHIDAKQYLHTLSQTDYPDVIYIDPMHPARQKSALVKKDMQVLQRLIGSDDDVHALIQLAITRTRHRVVVKWPQRLPALLQPDASIPGKTVRFDIYTRLAIP